MFFLPKKSKSVVLAHDFSYLDTRAHYFDSACQTLRPQEVIEAEEQYYRQYNACGGRVKYPWGEKVDTEVAEARRKMLRYVGKKSDTYDVVFTMNTTSGVNLVLQQIDGEKYERIVTSEIEHNSVFLPTMVYAKRTGVVREVLSREESGALQYTPEQLKRAIVMVNMTSNIDGRHLVNAQQLADNVHAQGGLLLLDVAQTLGHTPELLHDVDFDACFGSVHKMYGPSLGVVVIKKTLIKQLRTMFLGGGTVSDVFRDTYTLIDDEGELHARLETGLLDWAAIAGLHATLSWIDGFRPEGRRKQDHMAELSQMVHAGLTAIPGLHVLGEPGSTTFSVYHDRADAHTIALYAAGQQLMMRSGYFCCHYYLKNLREYPPLLRISLGLHNTRSEVQFLLETLEQLYKAY